MPTLNLPYDEIRDDQFSIGTDTFTDCRKKVFVPVSWFNRFGFFFLVYDQSTEDGAIVKKIEVENPPVEATVKPGADKNDNVFVIVIIT